MKLQSALLTAASLVLLNLYSSAATLYVDLNSANPTPPYADWSTAATNIQDAVDASINGDLVLVTNGVYQFGGRFVSSLSNRVALTKSMTVQSIGGPQVTVILAGGSSRSPVRCAFLTNGAVLAGFTLTGGSMSAGQGLKDPFGFGGGAYCQSVTAILTNCTVVSNTASIGGGVYQGTLNNCIIVSNTANGGGGTYQSILNNCAVVGNSAGYGGAAVFGTLNNCTLTGNSATSFGGGAVSNTLNNCIAYYNTAPTGLNYSGCALNYSCTTPLPAGGINNFSDDPLLASAFHISAASPCRGAGNIIYNSGVDIDGETWPNPPSVGCDEYVSGNFTGPLTVGIIANYTNVAVGFAVNLTGLVSGNASANVWNFGDDASISNHIYTSHVWTNVGDYTVTFTAYNDDFPGGVSATQSVHVVSQNIFYVSQSNATPSAPYADWTTAATNIQDAVDLAVLPGQWVLVSNGVYQTGGRLYGATSTTNRVAITGPVRVASVNGPLVTSIVGQRAAGGGDGPSAIRCVYLASGAILDGFTLTSGATGNSDSGGGVFCLSTAAIVTNCIFFVNYAYLGAGAFYGTLNNCTFIGNSAYGYGGAAYDSTLNNCIISNNAVNIEGGGLSVCIANNCVLYGNRGIDNGGGGYYSTLNNCILRKNLAENGAAAYFGTLNNCTVADNYAYTSIGGTYQSVNNNCIIYGNASAGIANSSGGTFNYCCTTPLPAGTGNITNEPAFVDLANGDFHLQFNSPCINSGNDAYVTVTNDLDGNPRIVGGTVDIGAYEYQTPSSVLSYAWAQQYGLPTDGSADYVDSDGDGMNNWQEWRTGTSPIDVLSVLKMLTPIATNSPSGVMVSWQSVSNVTYYLQSSTNLGAQPAFSTIQSNLVGQTGTTSYTDTTATNGGPYFYRVGVQ